MTLIPVCIERLKASAKPMLPIPAGLDFRIGEFTSFRAILFDVYGTLFISASGDISVQKQQSRQGPELEALLKKYGVSSSPEVLLESFFAAVEARHEALKDCGVQFPEVRYDQIWRSVLGPDLSEDALLSFVVELEWLFNPVYPMPHLKELLEVLRQRKLPMGIVSNAQFFTPYLFEIFLDQDIKTLGFDPDLVMLSYQMGHAKPSPLLFEKAAEALKGKGVPVDQALYVGNDMLNDVWAASTAGFKTALFAADRRSLRLRLNDDRCKALSPDMIITDLIQLADLLHKF